MKFIDRNYLHKKSLEVEGKLLEQKPENLAEATSDYEANVSDVIVFLKKCGYPLENCFISFFSPVFSAFINCGLDPLPSSIKITKDDLQNNKVDKDENYRLQLKFLWGIRSETKADEEEVDYSEAVVNDESSVPNKTGRQ